MASAAPMFDAATTQVNQALVQSLLGVTGTSTTSNTIGTGAKTFTTQTGLGFPIGMPVKFTDVTNVSNYMKGTITGYNSGTGALSATIATTNGSGTIANWQIAFDVPSGSSGYVPVGGLVPFKNLGSSFTDNGATWLKAGVIATSATYPLAPSVTILDGTTWVAKTGVSITGGPVMASSGTGTVIATNAASSVSSYIVSTDGGASWATQTLPASGIFAVVWCGTYFLLINSGGSSGSFYTSTTGLTGSWTLFSVPVANYRGFAYGANGCVVTTDTTAGILITSSTAYTNITLPVAQLTGAYGNGMYLMYTQTAYTSTMYKSFNGSVFFSITAPQVIYGAFSIYYPPSLVFGNGVFMYLYPPQGGSSGFTTPDGITFSTFNSGLPSNAAYLLFGGGSFVLINNFGTVISWVSKDNGVTWTAGTSVSGNSFMANYTGAGFACLVPNSTTAYQSVSGGTYTDTAKALFADSPANTRPYYMRVA
ncbi:hypothetical protein ACO0LB_09955 [Undibacterium sp. SXout7W]|uniref:hypothetical protein n=1 Tax=Undibacterium sp. SXout7W TaxID=3413049 RepID=UPI003BF15ACB